MLVFSETSTVTYIFNFLIKNCILNNGEKISRNLWLLFGKLNRFYRGRHKGPKSARANFVSFKGYKNCRVFEDIFPRHRWINNQKSHSVIQRAALKNNRAYLLRTEITKSRLSNHICQYCGMKTSTVTPSFYYVFNVSLYCDDGIPSFNGNLWRVLLLGNRLNRHASVGTKISLNQSFPDHCGADARELFHTFRSLSS